MGSAAAPWSDARPRRSDPCWSAGSPESRSSLHSAGAEHPQRMPSQRLGHRDAACPISTGCGTRRVHLVRGWGGGEGARASARCMHADASPLGRAQVVYASPGGGRAPRSQHVVMQRGPHGTRVFVHHPTEEEEEEEVREEQQRALAALQGSLGGAALGAALGGMIAMARGDRFRWGPSSLRKRARPPPPPLLPSPLPHPVL